MQPENGWFQLESQRPVRDMKSSDRGMPASRPAPERGRTMRDDEANNCRGGDIYGPHPERTACRAQPQSVPDMQYAGFNTGSMPDVMYGMNAPMPRDEYIGRAPDPYEGMADQNVQWPATAPDKLPGGYGRQETPVSWASDRALDTHHSQTVGPRGPVLEQDSTLHEALEVFVHTKILERPVHVKGYGAFGYFQATRSMKEYTKLWFLQSPGQQVPVMARYSLAAGNKGTPDTSRNVRAMSIKFYTQEGIFDLLCNHIPVLFVRDGLRFPEAFTSLAPSPVNNLIDPERFWRFVARAPEAMHFVTWLYSDLGTVRSLRHIRFYGVNTYVWRNAEGVRRYVKYHWIPVAGEWNIDRQEAVRLAGINPDIAGQDVYDTISAGHPVQYELRVQLMDPGDEYGLAFDPLDCTKVWDERRYPLIPVGRLTLNRNPDNYMEQVEKAAFSPSNLLPGAELSDDKLLQARANIYWDSQRRRLGEDFRGIPVNSQKNWTPDEQVTSGAGMDAEGRLVRSELCNPDNFTQAGEHYMSLPSREQDHLADNLAADLAAVSGGTRSTVLKYLHCASAELGRRVTELIEAYKRQ